MTRIWIGIIKKPIEGGGGEGPVADIIGSLKSGEGFFFVAILWHGFVFLQTATKTLD